MQHITTKQHAFTIIEMLIAISIALAATGVITAMFTSTSSLVSLSASTSQIINNARSISEQAHDDAESMVGPADGGVLIVVNYMAGNWDRTDIVKPGDYNNSLTLSVGENEGAPFRTYPEVPSGTQMVAGRLVVTPPRRGVRSDQVLFFRESGPGDSLRSITPSTADTLGGVPSALIPVAPLFARVWYGHVQRVLPDSSDPNAELGGGTSDDVDGAVGYNLYANNWILGRQALMLLPRTAFADNAVWINTNHVQSIRYNATVVGIVHPYSPHQLYTGSCDLANFDIVSNTGDPCLSGPVNAQLPPDLTAPLRPRPTPNYVDTAYDMMFVQKDRRLRVNPSPTINALAPSVIGQTHPYFAGNVSDFIVEFAADMNDDKQIDTDAYGNIRWYSHFGSTAPSYSYGDARFVAINADPTSSYWGPDYPKPVYDRPAGSEGPADMPAYSDAAFMWRANLRSPANNDAQLTWPYLLRFRYRLHDQVGRITSDTDPEQTLPDYLADSGSGRWFESVVRVNRNDP